LSTGQGAEDTSLKVWLEQGPFNQCQHQGRARNVRLSARGGRAGGELQEMGSEGMAGIGWLLLERFWQCGCVYHVYLHVTWDARLRSKWRE
jgi:hypothetical protein